MWGSSLEASGSSLLSWKRACWMKHTGSYTTSVDRLRLPLEMDLRTTRAPGAGESCKRAQVSKHEPQLAMVRAVLHWAEPAWQSCNDAAVVPGLSGPD